MKAPIGSLLDKASSRSKRESRHFPKYLNLIRQCPCLICGAQAEAAHLRMSSAKYEKLNGKDDKWVNPLCPSHHRLDQDSQHQGSEFEFWQRHKIDACDIANQLWNARNDLENMIAICVAARP